MSQLLQGLNDRQLAAVKDTVNTSALVLAGAGSGKTKVLTTRIAYLIVEHNVNPLSIMSVTFTNKASREMQHRVAGIIGEENAKKLTMGTFHSICVQMLKRFGDRTGIQKNFTIADSSDQESAMKDALRQHNVGLESGVVRGMLSKVSDLKNKVITPERYDKMVMAQEPHTNPTLAKVYRAYQDRLRKYNMLDFDDLLLESVRLLSTNEDTRKYYQSRYKYILIDEYQDTNPVQYKLIQLLSGKLMNTQSTLVNVFSVGDDSQAIYGFRGSDIDIILNFKKDFPEATIIRLEQNYRSTKTVVEAGNHIIKHNKKRMDKTLFTDNPSGDKISVHKAKSSRDEAEFVAQEISNLITFARKNPRDFAVLYRTNFLSRELEMALIKYRIPYNIVGGTGFYDRMEIKDTIAYLKVVANPQDDIAMERVLSIHPGVGKTTIEKIKENATTMGMSLAESFRMFKSNRKATQDALDTLRQLLQEIFLIFRVSKTEVRPDPVTTMMNIAWQRTAYRENLKAKKNKDNISRLENLDELLRVAKEYEESTQQPTLEDFLDGIMLQTAEADKQSQNAVSLMTVHASKGLEYPVVFGVGMEENIFPHKMNSGTPEGMEEERRLAYVAITRAKEKLYLSHCTTRKTYQGEEWMKESRFLDELPKQLLQQV